MVLHENHPQAEPLDWVSFFNYHFNKALGRELTEEEIAEAGAGVKLIAPELDKIFEELKPEEETGELIVTDLNNQPGMLGRAVVALRDLKTENDRYEVTLFIEK